MSIAHSQQERKTGVGNCVCGKAYFFHSLNFLSSTVSTFFLPLPQHSFLSFVALTHFFHCLNLYFHWQPLESISSKEKRHAQYGWSDFWCVIITYYYSSTDKYSCMFKLSNCTAVSRWASILNLICLLMDCGGLMKPTKQVYVIIKYTIVQHHLSGLPMHALLGDLRVTTLVSM